ncbi:MAG: PQQ-binding-like beta-propeller repeat protein [Planctomycetia bacterium]|nr:PQQ-binding-like beta-propeller repeat protein [Planctomycetia bacterium]
MPFIARVWHCLAVTLLFAGAASVPAAPPSWPDKSGPTFDGHVAESDAAGLPTEWDEASGKNIAWKIKLEGEGHSTPVIGDGRVWLTAATKDGKQQFVDCIDAASGHVLHHKLLFENPEPEPLGNGLNTYASPSPVLEEDALFVHFGTYGTARLDPKTAEVVWQRRDINCRHFRGPGSSPVVFEDLLILTFDGIDQQFLTALDKRTGKTVWRTDRSTDYHDLAPDGKVIGDGDYRKAFCTPGLVKVGAQTQLVSVGSRAAFGYDARTGQEIWTIEHDDYNAAPRPIFFRRESVLHAILDTGANGADLVAVRLDESTRGNVTKSHVTWMRSRGNARLPTPVLVGKRIVMVTDGGVLYGLSAATGSELWSKRLNGTFVSSPVVANGLVYLCDEDGRTTVVRAGGTCEVVAENVLSEGMRASPAVAEGAFYLRTRGHLYKIAKLPSRK